MSFSDKKVAISWDEQGCGGDDDGDGDGDGDGGDDNCGKLQGVRAFARSAVHRNLLIFSKGIVVIAVATIITIITSRSSIVGH